MKRRNHRRRPMSLESLENRTLLAADIAMVELGPPFEFMPWESGAMEFIPFSLASQSDMAAPLPIGEPLFGSFEPLGVSEANWWNPSFGNASSDFGFESPNGMAGLTIINRGTIIIDGGFSDLGDLTIINEGATTMFGGGSRAPAVSTGPVGAFNPIGDDSAPTLTEHEDGTVSLFSLVVGRNEEVILDDSTVVDVRGHELTIGEVKGLLEDFAATFDSGLIRETADIRYYSWGDGSSSTGEAFEDFIVATLDGDTGESDSGSEEDAGQAENDVDPDNSSDPIDVMFEALDPENIPEDLRELIENAGPPVNEDGTLNGGWMEFDPDNSSRPIVVAASGENPESDAGEGTAFGTSDEFSISENGELVDGELVDDELVDGDGNVVEPVEDELIAFEMEFAQTADDQFGLSQTGNDFEDGGGAGEKWLWSASHDWCYITPAGDLSDWDGGEGATGDLMAQLSSRFHADMTLLTEPANTEQENDTEAPENAGESIAFGTPFEFTINEDGELVDGDGNIVDPLEDDLLAFGHDALDQFFGELGV